MLRLPSLSVLALSLLASTLARAAGGTTTYPVYDPAFNNMKAFTLTVPAGWKFQGTVMTSPCTFLPWTVFRAYSPDGLTEMRTAPVVGWAWRPGIRGLDPAKAGCLPIGGQITAAQFLHQYVETIPGGVHIVGSMPISPQYQAWAQRISPKNSDRSGAGMQTQFTVDTAALHIQTHNGTFTVDQRVRVAVECSLQSNAGPMNGGTCFARVDTLRAPEGKLDALITLTDGQDLPHQVSEPAWQEAMLRRQNEEAARRMEDLRAAADAGSRMLRQQHEQFMATMQHNHEAFEAQQESSFRSSMNAANASMNARTTSASDWVDYALDQQTTVGANGLQKVSNDYGNTWSDGAGHWYQTTDPNANPNGVLTGNWSRDTKVHGNGQPF